MGVPANLSDGDDLSTRTLFRKCVGEAFVIAGVEQPEGMSQRLIRLDVGHMVGEEPYLHTIWIEEDLVEPVAT